MPRERSEFADQVIIGSDIRVRLYSAAEVPALEPNACSDALRDIVQWCENFLARPSNLLGRTGNVCPFVPEAMTRGTLKFACIQDSGRGREVPRKVEKIIARLRDRFLAEEEAQGKINIFNSWVMIFLNIAEEEYADAIDTPQKRLKPSFVNQGLMLGEFYSTCLSPGIRNSSFRPLRSPLPLLAIRHMVESDIDFLSPSCDPVPVQIESLRAYLQFLGSSLSLGSRQKAREALRVLEAEAAHLGLNG